YFEKVFEKQGLQPASRLPVAAEIGQRSLMFMVHPTLNAQDMHDIVNAVDKVMTTIASKSANHRAA
ncbi:MAG: aminotransferase, partial [Planctomyces sp.]|nr:aminotransferase [Planctomyces sp.]